MSVELEEEAEAAAAGHQAGEGAQHHNTPINHVVDEGVRLSVAAWAAGAV